jgi:hypothetical protein
MTAEIETKTPDPFSLPTPRAVTTSPSVAKPPNRPLTGFFRRTRKPPRSRSLIGNLIRVGVRGWPGGEGFTHLPQLVSRKPMAGNHIAHSPEPYETISNNIS